jgi:hypothetical protein
MTYCAVCNQVLEIAIDDVAGMAVHRYFQHGSWGERVARWGISAAVAIFVPKLVPRVVKEVGRALA